MWTKMKQNGQGMLMGFGMGAMIGASAPAMHCLINRVPLRGMGKMIGGSAMTMGSIFAFGSLVRT